MVDEKGKTLKQQENTKYKTIRTHNQVKPNILITNTRHRTTKKYGKIHGMT